MKDKVRLEHMLDAIEVVEAYVGEFGLESKQNLDACIRYIMVIGEAANHVSEETKQRLPQIPWPTIISMRHFLVHEYHHIDYDVVKEVIRKELPMLKKHMLSIVQP